MAGLSRLAPPAPVGTSIRTAAEDVRDQLLAAGLRATLDHADLNPPACLVNPPALEWTFGAGQYTATWSVLCVVAGGHRGTALGELGDLVDAAAAALGYRPTSARPVDVTLPDGGLPLPGYELTWSATIRPRPTP